MTPLVSICLPTRNSRRFLHQRWESIQEQTWTNWELIALDSYSTDGTRELLEELRENDERVQLYEAEADGIYTNINRCIEKARGTYVYIATSDDTMALDCLERLVDALENNRQCDLAHCKVRIIDEHGADIPVDWWSQASVFAISSGDWVNRRHVRKAPFDGLLHLIGDTVYTSLTQLLIRRSLFDRIGLFASQWGSISDFNWTMRATLSTDTVHAPDTWAGWRQHSAQATARAGLESPRYRANIDEMIESAMQSCAVTLPPPLRRSLERHWLDDMKDMRHFIPAVRACATPAQRRLFLLRQLLSGSWTARQHVRSKLAGGESLPESAPRLIRDWLKRMGIDPVLSLAAQAA